MKAFVSFFITKFKILKTMPKKIIIESYVNFMEMKNEKKMIK